MTIIVIAMMENEMGNVEVSISGGHKGDMTKREKQQCDALIDHLKNNLADIGKKAGAHYAIFHDAKSKPQNQ